MGHNKHDAEAKMVRPTPESHFVTKQRDAEAVNVARRIIRGLAKEGDQDRLRHLINRGAVIRIGKRRLTYSDTIRESILRKAKKGHQHGNKGN